VETTFNIIQKDHPLSPPLRMQFPLSMMQDNIWADRLHYIEAEELIHISKSSPQVSNVSSSLVSDITAMRNSINSCVSGRTTTTTNIDDQHVARLEEENRSLKKTIEELSRQVGELTLRVGKLEGNAPAVVVAPQIEKAGAAQDDDDDDFDMFGSDEEEEEETEEEKAKKAELLKKYHEKKSKKPVIIAKSNIILDVKPWDDETDMVEMERLVRTIEMDGLLWGDSKLVAVGYGIKKLQISCVVEDDKVGTDVLDEQISAFEDHVQSVDIAAFNKI